MSDVTTVILAGGRGQRLAPLTTVIPKPLMPVGDRSIIEVLIRQLVADGLTRIVISIGHLGHLIRAVLGDGSSLGADITYVAEDEPLGTAGALRLVETDSETYLVLNGDLLTDLNYAEVVQRHQSTNCDLTVVAVNRRYDIDFGVLEVDSSGQLIKVSEKPSFSHLVAIGINVISARCLTELSASGRVDMPDFYQQLGSTGFDVRVDAVDCEWHDLGRVEDLRQANDLLSEDPGRFIR